MRSERWLGRTEFRPTDYMRAFVIDDEFFNQSAIEATPRSSCRPALEKRLDTADIVRDVCITGLSDTCCLATTTMRVAQNKFQKCGAIFERRKVSPAVHNSPRSFHASHTFYHVLARRFRKSPCKNAPPPRQKNATKCTVKDPDPSR